MTHKGYTVRLAAPSDAAAVEALLQESYQSLMAPAYTSAVMHAALPLITRANTALLASGTYYVAESREGSIVGCGGWTLERPTGTQNENGSAGHLRHFATHPDWTRRGIGRAIVSECERQARPQVAALEVYSSLNGEPFYAALGFARVRNLTVKLRPELSLAGVILCKRFYSE